MRSNDGAGRPAGHVIDQVDLYLTGALSRAQRERFEEHLLLCPACRAHADHASEIAVLVAMLPAEVVAEIERAGAAAARKGRGRPAARRPAAGRPTAAAVTGRGTRRIRRAFSYAAVLLVGVALGSGAGLVYASSDVGRVPVDDQTSQGARAQLSVTATGLPVGTGLRAITVGLRTGEEYALIAVGKDGGNYIVAQGVAAGGPQTIVGAVPVPRDQLRFVALMQGELLLVTSDF
jgi:anti-sigma factor RsiW